jgi:hypothetical protein
MIINENTKLLDILNEHPELEEYIISLAPPFRNLKNPILRKTIGRLATLEKAAIMGGLKVNDFMNSIREKLGMEMVIDLNSDNSAASNSEPEWIKQAAAHTVNGIEMLGQGIHPLNEVFRLMGEINHGEHVLLITNFTPVPLIDAMQAKGFNVFTQADKQVAGVINNYIQK